MNYSISFDIILKSSLCHLMNDNKITIAINPNQNKKNPPQVDGMIALKKIENYSYALTDEIGLGFSSRVYRGKNDLNNEIVAIKVIDLRKEDQLSKQFVNEEINILETIKMRNPQNLLKLFDVFKTKNNLYIITEFCEGKDVAKLLRKKKFFSEMEAQSILKQLLSAYRQLFQLQIVHRDLKLANVFIKKGVIKLADFGFAIRSDRCLDKFQYNVGSPYYMPPESLKFNRYSFKSDVWSFGVIAYEMAFGKLPWKEKVETVLFEKITNTPIEELFDPQVQLSEHYKKFIYSCLQIDYEKRATPEFIINYEWPMAQDYVDGVEPDLGSYKPHSLIKIPSSNGPNPMQPKQFGTANTIDDEIVRPDRIFKVQHQVSMPISQPRDKSPASKHDLFKHFPPFEDPQKQKTPFLDNPQKPLENFQQQPTFGNVIADGAQFPEVKNIAELSILTQVHFCRFLSQLFDLLQQSSSLPQGYLLKSELANRILGKCDLLMKLNQGENFLMVEAFNQYKIGEKWRKLKEVIQRYDRKYREKFNLEYRSESNDQILVHSIKYLKNNITANFHLLQELTYYFQLRELERRLAPSHFAVSSKLDLLCGRKAFKSETASATNCERLNLRLTLLGLV